ncbi:NAD(P)-dependent oxidoreductase [Sphingomonas sp. ST-64]|uniref:NAD(P)-dependent oxidoreductase n=1 Tax=Sphingomonas plantiphila TaxID=3163295 RepID=A0ABW8YJK8_9SPHN
MKGASKQPKIGAVRALCLLQKPYDLINATEYLERYYPDATLDAAVIGIYANSLAVAELCKQRGIPVTHIDDPDLYARWVAYLNAKQNLSRALLLVVKALILPLAYLYWFYAFFRLRAQLRGNCYDLVILDAWRSKCFYLSAMPAGALISITDGGYSTLHYGLCPAFERGGARELVATSLRQQRPLMPGLLRKLAVARFSAQTPFFTCYAREFAADCAFPVLTNDYRHCSAVLGAKTLRRGVMIMGIPRLKHIDTYIRHALDAQTAAGLPRDVATIEYRFHPTDRNRTRLDANYGKMIERGVAERGMSSSYPRYSLEMDFLDQAEIPEIIVTYASSSVPWIEQVFGSRVRLIRVADR